mmetsp:Transcript_129282/g.360049  ORF Transcript_129282/g.360049 Transcript_129282/m.360049 type:complete len:232 (+) Transcript_129282:546-1241(+)
MPSMLASLLGGTMSNTRLINICAMEAIRRFEFHCSSNSSSFSNCEGSRESTHRCKSTSPSAPNSWSATSAALPGCSPPPPPAPSSSLASVLLWRAMHLSTTSMVWLVRICLICPGRLRSRAKVRAASIFPSRTRSPIRESFMASSASASWRSFACSSVVSRQRQSFESEPPDTICWPIMSMHQTFPVCSSKVAEQSAVLICQSFKSPSTLLVIICMPFARKHTRSTAAECP